MQIIPESKLERLFDYYRCPVNHDEFSPDFFSYAQSCSLCKGCGMFKEYSEYVAFFRHNFGESSESVNDDSYLSGYGPIKLVLEKDLFPKGFGAFNCPIVHYQHDIKFACFAGDCKLCDGSEKINSYSEYLIFFKNKIKNSDFTEIEQDMIKKYFKLKARGYSEEDIKKEDDYHAEAKRKSLEYEQFRFQESERKRAEHREWLKTPEGRLHEKMQQMKLEIAELKENNERNARAIATEKANHEHQRDQEEMEEWSYQTKRSRYNRDRSNDGNFDYDNVGNRGCWSLKSKLFILT